MAKRRVRGGDPDGVALPDEAAATVTTESATEESRLTNDQKAKKAKDEKTLALLRKRIKTGLDGFSHFRKNAILDSKFRAGTWGDVSYQWDQAIEAERKDDQRPCFTINRVPSTIHQVTNQIRGAHLRIVVNPVNDKADPKVAEVLQGIIRNIEVTSLASVAYNRAADKQAEIGFGVFRLITEWQDEHGEGEDDDLFRQRIRIKSERNPLRILFDPAYEELDASDASWALKYTDINRADFKDIVGDDPPNESDIESFLEAEGAEAGEWFPTGKIRYVEYISRELYGERRHVALLSNGRVIDYPDEKLQVLLKQEGLTIDNERWVQARRFMWRHCTALKVHKETVWAGDAQPWIPAIGDELEIEGVRDFRGVVRDGKDPARATNALSSAVVEAATMGLKAPVVGYRGQFGAEDSPIRKAWSLAHRKRLAFLEVEPMDIDGKPAPRPEPITFEPPIQNTMVALRQLIDDYKTTTSWHDASLGERGPQESGVAIDARKQQDQVSNSHYLDNMKIALTGCGRRLIRLIRSTFDVPTVLRITGDDDRERRVMVFTGAGNDPRNEQFLQTHSGPMPLTMKDGTQVLPGGKIPFQLPEGISDIYDLGVGEYQVEVNAGQGEGTKRQEELDSITAVFKMLPPQESRMFLDLWFMLMDHPVARQMAERAKKLLPPEMQDDEQGSVQLPPQVAAMVAQYKAQIQKMTQALAEAKQIITTKATEARGRLMQTQEQTKSHERIAEMEAHVRLLEQQRDIKAEQALTLLKGAIAHIALSRTQDHEKDLATLESVVQMLENAGDRTHDINLRTLDAALAPPAPPQLPPGAEPPDSGGGEA